MSEKERDPFDVPRGRPEERPGAKERSGPRDFWLDGAGSSDPEHIFKDGDGEGEEGINGEGEKEEKRGKQ